MFYECVYEFALFMYDSIYVDSQICFVVLVFLLRCVFAKPACIRNPEETLGKPLGAFKKPLKKLCGGNA